MKLPFTKMQGLGNDYIYIDARARELTDLPALARRLSDRHFGIGGDGIVLITNSPTCDFGMRIFNADGSEAQMCGNASRCVGKYVYERGLTRKTTLTLDTLAGVKTLSLHLSEGRVETVSVDMGIPAYLGQVQLAIGNETFAFERVDMGNPHAVCLTTEAQLLDRVQTVGARVENHPFFALERTNVELVCVRNRHELDMRVWERGSGETLACGTGACASVVAARECEMVDNEVVVHLRGGDLHIAICPNGHIEMTGKAEFVFSGTIEI